MASKPKFRKGLIKKGSPLPTRPRFKFESAHLKERDADKAEHDLLDKPKTVETLQIRVPKQTLVYRKSRITPKRPKLRR